VEFVKQLGKSKQRSIQAVCLSASASQVVSREEEAFVDCLLQYTDSYNEQSLLSPTRSPIPMAERT
jgi:hypothetical protein